MAENVSPSGHSDDSVTTTPTPNCGVVTVTDDTVMADGCAAPQNPPRLMQPFVQFDEINFREKVGHGSYGVVYKALWRNQLVAVKEFGASAEQKAIETEVKQLSRVRHPNIIALYGISADQQSKYLIMEYAEGGSLHNFLHGKVKPYYSTAHAMSWARQCAEGVAYLHAMKPKPLIHRDLKPLNLLLTNKGRQLKICDFGTVADKSTWMTNNKGSAAWMAPEVFEGSKYTEKCDVFSWAIVLWEVLSRQQPFKEIDNTYSIMWKIHKGERPPLLRDCPQRIQNLMTSCWATTPDLRPSMQHVVNVMNELVALYPGADEALEYEFINQQIIQSKSSGTISSSDLDLGSTSSENVSATTQTTTTNATSKSSSKTISSATTTPTEAPEAQIPTDDCRNPFFVTPSDESGKRYNTIRNGMTHLASILMAPLSLDVDPNAWELGDSTDNSSVGEFNPFAKSDGNERLTVTETRRQLSPEIGDSGNHETEDNDDGTDQSLHEILDLELRPEPPIGNNAQSQEIYEEHRRLAKEFLRVDTKLYYAQDLKDKLLSQMDPAEREQKQEILKKMNEKKELLELYKNLKQQLEKMRSTAGNQQSNPPSSSFGGANAANSEPVADDGADVLPANDLVSDDDWVLIAPHNNNNNNNNNSSSNNNT